MNKTINLEITMELDRDLMFDLDVNLGIEINKVFRNQFLVLNELHKIF